MTDEETWATKPAYPPGRLPAFRFGADGFTFYSANVKGIRDFANRVTIPTAARRRRLEDCCVYAAPRRSVKSVRHLIPDDPYIYEATYSIIELRDLS